MSEGRSKVWLAAGAVILLPAASALIWKTLRSKKESDSHTSTIPLWEKPARLEKFLFVRARQVGLVLGKQLRNIRRFEHETRAIINLVSYAPDEVKDNVAALAAFEDAVNNWNNNNDEEDATSGKDERLHFLRIHAQTQDQIQLVELALEAQLADARRRMNVDELRVPAESVKHIIGRGGDHIKRLSRQFRVCMKITQTGEDYETVRLEGTPEGIDGAKRRILEKIDYTTRPEEDEEIEQSVEEQVRELLDLKTQLETAEEWW